VGGAIKQLLQAQERVSMNVLIAWMLSRINFLCYKFKQLALMVTVAGGTKGWIRIFKSMLTVGDDDL
jgi:hypothetical protein